MGPPDGINALIFTIIKHFIGTPSNITERIHDQWCLDFLLEGAMGGRPYCSQKVPNSYLA